MIQGGLPNPGPLFPVDRQEVGGAMEEAAGVDLVEGGVGAFDDLPALGAGAAIAVSGGRWLSIFARFSASIIKISVFGVRFLS